MIFLNISIDFLAYNISIKFFTFVWDTLSFDFGFLFYIAIGAKLSFHTFIEYEEL